MPCMISLDVNMGSKEGKPGIEVDRRVSRVLAEQEPVHSFHVNAVTNSMRGNLHTIPPKFESPYPVGK